MKITNPIVKTTSANQLAGWFRTVGAIGLVLLLPAAVQAQYRITTNNATITITGYTGAGGAAIIPDGITTIGDGAFYNYPSLTSVTLPASVTSIGNDAFYYCSGLTAITLGTGVTNIGALAFSDCTSLTSLTIPASVISIGMDAFLGDTSLGTITVDAANPSFSSLGGVLFDRAQDTLLVCPAGYPANNYTVPHSVSSIGQDAFAWCLHLTSIKFDGVTNVGPEAFAASGLTSVTIPNSISILWNSPFDGCTNLTCATVAASVSSLESEAFLGCYSLSAVYFLGNAPADDGSEFYDDHLTVYYLAGTTGWGPTLGGMPAVGIPVLPPVGPGVRTNQFGFTLIGYSNQVVVVQGCTNLSNPVWSPVGTNTLTGGTSYFSDLQWTNYPERFYRLCPP